MPRLFFNLAGRIQERIGATAAPGVFRRMGTSAQQRRRLGVPLQIFCLLTMIVPLCPGQKPATTGGAAGAQKCDYSVSGVTVSLPAGWRQLERHTISDIARWVKTDPKTGSIVQA